MLYDRWRQTVSERRHDLALNDPCSARQWTFAELAEEAERETPAGFPIAFPQGLSAEFVLSVLRAWRAGQVTLPLEAGQRPIAVGPLPSAIVHLKTTSATTGAPRLIACTAQQLMADAENIMQTMGLRADWPNLGTISLAHSYGFSSLVLPLLLHGIPLVLVNSPLPEAVRRSVGQFSAITLPAVPTLWRAWHDSGAIPQQTRRAISAGAPLPLSLEQEIFQTTGLKLHNFYGASECGGIAYDATEIPRTDAACVGTPMRNASLSVADDGCLEVRGAAVAESYWPEPDASLGHGCYHTSDLAQWSDGRVFLRGRASDQINVAGRKVTPEAVERNLLAHPLVRDCLVFGVPSSDEGRSEIIVAGVEARSRVAAESLRDFLLARLPAWQVPREWWFLDSLAPNRRGKLSRAEWRKRYLQRR